MTQTKNLSFDPVILNPKIPRRSDNIFGRNSLSSKDADTVARAFVAKVILRHATVKINHSVPLPDQWTSVKVSQRPCRIFAEYCRNNVSDWFLFRTMNQKHQLSSLFEGPYKVTEVNCYIRKRRKDVRGHLNLLIPYHDRESESELLFSIFRTEGL
jgi:hypothetical protein